MVMEGKKLTKDNVEAIASWCKGIVIVQHDALDDSIITKAVNLLTPTGVQRAQIGDIIIRDDDSFVIAQGESGRNNE